MQIEWKQGWKSIIFILIPLMIIMYIYKIMYLHAMQFKKQFEY